MEVGHPTLEEEDVQKNAGAVGMPGVAKRLKQREAAKMQNFVTEFKMENKIRI